MVLTLGVNTGLFDALAEDHASPKSVADLATKLGIEERLLGMF